VGWEKGVPVKAGGKNSGELEGPATSYSWVGWGGSVEETVGLKSILILAIHSCIQFSSHSPASIGLEGQVVGLEVIVKKQ
jgi:hypothetical protein